MLLLNEVDLQEHKGKIEARARVCIHDKPYLQLWEKKEQANYFPTIVPYKLHV